MEKSKERVRSFTWSGETGSGFLEELSAFVEQTCKKLHVDEKSCCHVQLAVGEAGANTREHAYGGETGRVRLEMVKSGHTLEIRLTDWGKSIDLDQVPRPQVGPDLEETKLDGLGVMIMRKAMDEITFETKSGGANQVTMRKRVNAH